MKKLILMLFLAAAIAYECNSQTITTSGGTMTIKSAEPDPICQCDTTTLKLNVRMAPNTDPNAVNYYIYLRYGATSNQFTTVASFRNSDLFVLPKVQGQFLYDTVYSYKWKIPCNFLTVYSTTGPSQALCNLVLSQLPGSTAKSFRVNDCTTGIPTYNSSAEKPVYYDLQGNIIVQRYNELIIEQVGLKRRKVIIQN